MSLRRRALKSDFFLHESQADEASLWQSWPCNSWVPGFRAEGLEEV